MRISRKNSETNQGLKAASINIKKGILKAAIKEGKKLDKAEQNSKRLKIVIPSPPEIKPQSSRKMNCLPPVKVNVNIDLSKTFNIQRFSPSNNNRSSANTNQLPAYLLTPETLTELGLPVELQEDHLINLQKRLSLQH